jgi:hypothetical protein
MFSLTMNTLSIAFDSCTHHVELALRIRESSLVRPPLPRQLSSQAQDLLFSPKNQQAQIVNANRLSSASDAALSRSWLSTACRCAVFAWSSSSDRSLTCSIVISCYAIPLMGFCRCAQISELVSQTPGLTYICRHAFAFCDLHGQLRLLQRLQAEHLF